MADRSAISEFLGGECNVLFSVYTLRTQRHIHRVRLLSIDVTDRVIDRVTDRVTDVCVGFFSLCILYVHRDIYTVYGSCQ